MGKYVETAFPPEMTRRGDPPLATHGEISFLTEAPAVNDPGWLPEGKHPALDELRAEHLRLLAMAREAGAEESEVERRLAEEDAAYTAAVNAELAGNQVVLPERTDPVVKAQMLRDLRERSMAVVRLREQFTKQAIATIQEHYEEWIADLDIQDAAAADAVDEAQRALAEAKAALGQSVQLRLWLDRTSGRRGGKGTAGRHIAYSDLDGVGLDIPPITESDASTFADVARGRQPLTPQSGRAAELAERAYHHDTQTQETTPHE